MPHPSRRPASVAVGPDLIVGLDLAHAEYQAVVLAPTGERLTRFRVPHPRAGIAELLRRTTPRTFGHAGGRRFAFEATGHIWEALAHRLAAAGERYMLVNPLATFRVRRGAAGEARSMDRHKTDLTDAEQIAELARTGLVTRTQPGSGRSRTARPSRACSTTRDSGRTTTGWCSGVSGRWRRCAPWARA